MPLKLKTQDKAQAVTTEQTKEKTQVQKQVTCHLCVFGLPEIQKLTVNPGTTLGQLIQLRNLEGIEVRVTSTQGGRSVAAQNNYILKEGDLVVVIPNAIEGGFVYR